ncbi:transposase [Ralstonia solanacearum]|uniref:transposase n=1 Tax=Ralstonia solanacearum TaxID=305 RepID=UPI0018D03CAB
MSHAKDGRRKFDEQSKRSLIEACLKPGVSVARMAQTHGVNANLLRKWITRYLMGGSKRGRRQRSRSSGRTPSTGRGPRRWCVYRHPGSACK